MEILILGGGIAGLAAANRLIANGIRPTIIERNARLGGLTRSIYADKYVFDYTGHFLHLARLQHPHDLGIMKRGKWKQMERKAFCLVKGAWLDAPFQYNLGQLPDPLRKFCYESYLATNPDSPTANKPTPANLLEFFYASFGVGITDLFLKPYNEKLLAVSTQQLSVKAMNRFFPAPDRQKIEAGMRAKLGDKQIGYNAKFWYPEHDGIQQLIDCMTPEFTREPEDVLAISLETKTIKTSRSERKFDHVLSSLPLDRVMALADDQHLGAAAKELGCASVIAFQIGVAGQIPKDLVDRHWVYVPDPDVIFHRVGVYSNFNRAMAPEGCYSLYVEVGLFRPPEKPQLSRLQNQVVSTLEALGWLRSNQIETVLAHVIDHGYVHFTDSAQSVVPETLLRLAKSDFNAIGRYGTWDYISMEDGVTGAWGAVDALLAKVASKAKR